MAQTPTLDLLELLAPGKGPGLLVALCGAGLYGHILNRRRRELLELLELRRLQLEARTCTDANPCGWCRADSWCGRRVR